MSEIQGIWTIHIVDGVAVVPNTGLPGPYGPAKILPPVRQISVEDKPSLAVAIQEAISSGNPRCEMSDPLSEEAGKSILKLSKCKSWGAYHKRFRRMYTIELKDQEYRLLRCDTDARGLFIGEQKIASVSAADDFRPLADAIIADYTRPSLP